MRPTIDEQLAGAARLLRLAETDPDVTPEVVEHVRNSRRLVERVAGSWSAALPFLRDDNARTAALLGLPTPPAEDLAVAAVHNEELRDALAARIRQRLEPGDRAAIGAHLRARVARGRLT